jgi:RNA polymerase sigma factor (sigma-70 family)
LRHKKTAPFEIDADRDTGISDIKVEQVDSDEIRAIRLALRSGDIDLTETEHEVMRFRFGLHCPQNPPLLTLQKVGKQLGISKERVRQIQLRALAKIRDAVERYLPVDLLSE